MNNEVVKNMFLIWTKCGANPSNIVKVSRIKLVFGVKKDDKVMFLVGSFAKKMETSGVGYDENLYFGRGGQSV